MDQVNTIEPARVAGPSQDPRGDDWTITNFPRSVYSFTSVYITGSETKQQDLATYNFIHLSFTFAIVTKTLNKLVVKMNY